MKNYKKLIMFTMLSALLICELFCVSSCSIDVTSYNEDENTSLTESSYGDNNKETSIIENSYEANAISDGAYVRSKSAVLDNDETIVLSGELSDFYDPFKHQYIGYSDAGIIFFKSYENTIIKQVDINNGVVNDVMDISSNKNRHVMAILYENDWVIWSESNDKDLYIGLSTGANWAICAANLITQEIIEIDSENEYFPKERDFNAQPIGMSCKKGILAFVGYEADASGVYKAVKVFDFTTRALKTIVRQNEPAKGYSDPTVGDEFITFSISTIEDAMLKDNIVYIYNINDDQLSEITNDYNLVLPITSGQYLTAVQPAKIESVADILHIYDLKAEKWIGAIGNTSPIYADLRPSNVRYYDVQMYNDYLVWRTVINKELFVYNIRKDTYYQLLARSEGRNLGYVLHFNSNLLAWADNNSDNKDGHFRYVVLNNHFSENQ